MKFVIALSVCALLLTVYAASLTEAAANAIDMMNFDENAEVHDLVIDAAEKRIQPAEGLVRRRRGTCDAIVMIVCSANCAAQNRGGAYCIDGRCGCN